MDIAQCNRVPSAPATVFRRESVSGPMDLRCGVPGSPSGLEFLTPDVVLWVASGDACRAALGGGSVDGLRALSRTMCPRAAGVCLTNGTSCDPEVVEVCTILGRLFPRLLGACDP